MEKRIKIVQNFEGVDISSRTSRKERYGKCLTIRGEKKNRQVFGGEAFLAGVVEGVGGRGS